jgi:hypothetical protein
MVEVDNLFLVCLLQVGLIIIVCTPHHMPIDSDAQEFCVHTRVSIHLSELNLFCGSVIVWAVDLDARSIQSDKLSMYYGT